MPATMVVHKDTMRAAYYRALVTELRRAGRRKSRAHKLEVQELKDTIAAQQKLIEKLRTK